MKRFLKTAVIFAACATLFAACQKETPIEDDSPASYQGEDPAKTETPADNNQSGNVTNPSSGTVIPSTGNNSGTVGNNDNIPSDYNFGDVPFDKSELYVDINVKDVIFSKGDWIMIVNSEFNDLTMIYSHNSSENEPAFIRENGKLHNTFYFTVDDETLTTTKIILTEKLKIDFYFDDSYKELYSSLHNAYEELGYTFSGTTATLDFYNKDGTELLQAYNLDSKGYPYLLLESFNSENVSVKTNSENTKFYINYQLTSEIEIGGVSGTGLSEIYIMKK